MTDRPILFRAEMVRTMLEGRKTQTRRPAWRWVDDPDIPGSLMAVQKPTRWQSVNTGDRLWVREAHAFVGGCDPGVLLCKADWQETARRHRLDHVSQPPKWKSPIHMPRWASRITWIVTAVRIELLRHITVADARAEGFRPLPDGGDEWHAFLDYWNKLHGDGATDANPEVVVVTGEVHLCNIDKLPAQVAA